MKTAQEHLMVLLKKVEEFLRKKATIGQLRQTAREIREQVGEDKQ